MPSIKKPLLAPVLVFLALLYPMAAVCEDLLVGELRTAKSSPIYRQWISGAGEAIYTMNYRLQTSGNTPLYCPPDKMRLTTDNYVNVLNQELLRKSTADQVVALASVADILLDGLVRTFPCKK